MNGWIKLHRKIWDSEVGNAPLGFVVWLWLLTNCDRKTGIITCGPGEISERTGVGRETVKYWLKTLPTYYQLTTLSTTHRGTTYQICKWEEYQGETTQEATSLLPTHSPLLYNKKENGEEKSFLISPKKRTENEPDPFREPKDILRQGYPEMLEIDGYGPGDVYGIWRTVNIGTDTFKFEPANGGADERNS